MSNIRAAVGRQPPARGRHFLTRGRASDTIQAMVAGGETVSQGTLDPLFQVRILAGQESLCPALQPRKERGLAPLTNADPPGESLAVVLLAAGQGTRLRSRLPKPLHRLGGRPLIDHVLRAAAALQPAQTIVVTGHGADQLHQRLGLDGGESESAAASQVGRLSAAHQVEQLGTAHAVSMALPLLDPGIDVVIVLYADTPLITGEALERLVETRRQSGAPLALLACVATNPFGLGRVIRDEHGRVIRIVEEKVATAEEKGIVEINAGFYAMDATWLRSALPKVERSPTGEYLLPDLVAIAIADALPEAPWPVVTSGADFAETLGINDRAQLAEASAVLRARTHQRLMLAGVTIEDPATTYIDDTVEIGQDTLVRPFSVISGATRIGADCVIGPAATIDACEIGDRCQVVSSTLESSAVEAGTDIGPYAHLRPGARLGPGVHVGNFAEIKNSRIGAGTAIGHFSYLGDATVGDHVNIGAGTITANYDGEHKHPTTIGDDAFIGSDTILIAPVEVASGSYTAAGAVVNRDIPRDTIAIGVPARHRSRPARRRRS